MNDEGGRLMAECTAAPYFILHPSSFILRAKEAG